MKKVNFGIVGGGWRAQYYLRIAKELSENYLIGGVVVRDKNNGQLLEEKWGIKTYRTIEELLGKTKLSFMVLAVKYDVVSAMIKELINNSIPVLSETPPALDLKDLIQLNEFAGTKAKVQVAEQYQFQPFNAALISIINSGKLGTIKQAQVSITHGYHGMSLLRKFLGINFENVKITARNFTSSIIAGPDRSGFPLEEKIADSVQVNAYLDFGDKFGIYDFTGDQYFSWIRSPRVLIRGERGEINNNSVKYLKDFRTPINIELNRQNAGEDGNLEGCYHKGILAGEEWVYKNPFIQARFSDDEIAVATCLEKMVKYINGGPSFYNLAEASQDYYLSLMIDQSLKSKKEVETTEQIWAKN